jgi:hydroxymethylpyrimidine/phosphomethylpyrimidine kinase
MSAITAITAQNTVAVTAVQDISPDVVRAQIEAVVSDIGVDAAKTGMLHTSEIIKVVSEEVEKFGFPTVVDPVMIAKSRAALLKPEAVKTLIGKLLPLAAVVTPNAMEAEALSGMKVRTLDEAKAAAKRIAGFGPKAVVVKGGHVLSEKKAIDVLFYEGEIRAFEGERFETTTDHGTGCSFASAITAELAKGSSIVDAVGVAKEFVNRAIRFGLKIGRGHGPLNPMANLYSEAEKYSVLRNVREAIRILEETPEVASLIPEVQTNIVMALTNASSYLDVAGVPGRIVRTDRGVRASSCPEFGASRHAARTVLAVREHDRSIRSGMNVRYSEELVRVCKDLRLVVSFYDRRKEPPEVKKAEGKTTAWGAEQAIKRVGRVPDVIYHTGDWGKEPMITILGKSAVDVAKTAVAVAKRYAPKMR